MARSKKQATFSYRFVDPKTRQFVVPGTPGAKRIRVKINRTSKQPKRDAKGRFISPGPKPPVARKRKPSRKPPLKIVQKAPHRKRKFIKRWRGVARDGSLTEYQYERYQLQEQTPGEVQDILDHVKKRTEKRFLYNGQIDFLDADDKVFTNNTEFFSDFDKTAPARLIKSLLLLSVNPSTPVNFNRSEKSDVEAVYLVIRFTRLNRE